MAHDSEKYWYNLTTGEVEKGFESPAIDRAGPFDTAEEAAKAPEVLRERSRAWAEDEAREDGWESRPAGSGSAN
ncbi:SPOR domain-containing protein [Microbacterium kunmingense]|uniref:SPOR domain-containing protein n=1 Tax=Microbacterium kunmingense TaxID=2915939 RepID=UPI003D704D83